MSLRVPPVAHTARSRHEPDALPPGDALRARVSRSRPFRATELAALLALPDAGPIREAWQALDTPPAETPLPWEPGGFIGVSNVCRLDPVHWPGRPDLPPARVLTVEDLQRQLETLKRAGVPRVSVTARFWADLVVPGLRASGVRGRLSLLQTYTALLALCRETLGEGVERWAYSVDELWMLAHESARSPAYVLDALADVGLDALTGWNQPLLSAPGRLPRDVDWLRLTETVARRGLLRQLAVPWAADPPARLAAHLEAWQAVTTMRRPEGAPPLTLTVWLTQTPAVETWRRLWAWTSLCRLIGPSERVTVGVPVHPIDPERLAADPDLADWLRGQAWTDEAVHWGAQTLGAQADWAYVRWAADARSFHTP